MSKYSKEFKREALELSDKIGVKNTADQLGLHYYTLADWRKKRHREKILENSPETKQRIKQLEKEVAELRRTNHMLNKALNLSVENQKKH